MKVGFTGTQKGMTEAQQKGLRSLLTLLRPTEFHHGDCIGADAEAHRIVMYDLPLMIDPIIVVHPPIEDAKRANCFTSTTAGDRVLLPQHYLDRNAAIVADCDILLAAPKEFEEVRRSGTWATWRAARHIHRARIMILPDGRFDVADCDHLKIQLSTAEVSNG